MSAESRYKARAKRLEQWRLAHAGEPPQQFPRPLTWRQTERCITLKQPPGSYVDPPVIWPED